MDPSEFQQKVWYRTLTAVCITVLGGLLVGGIWVTGQVLAYLQPVLVPLAVAGILAYLIEPIVNILERKGLTRMKSILAVFIASFICISGFSAMIAVPLGNQVKRLNSNMGGHLSGAKKMVGEFGKFNLRDKLESVVGSFDDEKDDVLEGNEEVLGDEKPLEVEDEIAAPSLKEAFREYMNSADAEEELAVKAVPVAGDKFDLSNLGEYLNFGPILESLKKKTPDLVQRVVEAVTRGASKFFGIIGYALGFILVPIYLFYFLKESVVIQQNWRKFIPLRASKFKDEVASVLTEINAYLIAFFRGQVLVSIIDGVLVGIVLKMFGHPYAVLLGVSLAVLGVIPFIGNLICLVPAAITAYTHFSIESNQYWIGENPWLYVILFVGIFIVVQQINSLVTAPKIVGDSVGLHPMTVIFSMLFWSLLLGGFLGALLAVPLTASVKVIFRRYIWEKRVLNDEDLSDDEGPPEEAQLIAST